ncbi:hypothetical protein FCM35_KLT06346 [Carex littledalei]|uniref:Uncharacterized protein n=1 Tax=Carex littledalei TaxID=544730 RepID=A0A833QW56_9POAL|nr:hypothetical protein FCM35_KLT06346 [Carex littledalei]
MSSSSEDMDFDHANELEDANNSEDMDLDQANELEDVNNSGDDSGAANNKKPSRGPTMLLNLGAKETLPKVQFDEFERIIGTNAATFNNWVGLLARIKVDITIEKWPKFPKKEKEKLWKYVKV